MGVSLIKRKRGNRVSYVIQIYENGRKEYKSLFTASRNDTQAKKEAERQKAEYEAKFLNGALSLDTFASQSKDFLEFFEKLRDSKQTPKPYANTLNHLKKFTKGRPLPMDKLTKSVCWSFRDYLERCIDEAILKSSTASTYWNKFKAAVTDAFNREMLHHNPVSGIKGISVSIEEKPFLEVDEIRALVQTQLPESEFANVVAALFLFITSSGMRPSDATKLTWQDVRGDQINGFYVQYTPAKTRRKVGRLHHLPLHTDSVKIIGSLRSCSIDTKPTDIIFSPLPHPPTQLRILKKWFSLAGISKPATMYMARHSFASNLALNGVDIYQIGKLLSHTSTAHTQVYAHLTERAKRSAVEMLPAMFSTDEQKFLK